MAETEFAPFHFQGHFAVRTEDAYLHCESSQDYSAASLAQGRAVAGKVVVADTAAKAGLQDGMVVQTVQQKISEVASQTQIAETSFERRLSLVY